MRPCIFSRRASSPLPSRSMKGAGSLKKGAYGFEPEAVAAGVDVEVSTDTSIPHAASTAAAPPATISFRNRRRLIPRALTKAQRESASGGLGKGSGVFWFMPDSKVN